MVIHMYTTEASRTGTSASPDALFKAFADETRLRILHLLLGGELCVCHLTEALEISQPKVSRHLAYLRRVGLIEARQEGLWRHYRIAKSKRALHKKLLSCIACCMTDIPILEKDLARRKRLAEAQGDCC